VLVERRVFVYRLVPKTKEGLFVQTLWLTLTTAVTK